MSDPAPRPEGFLPLHPLEFRILMILLGGPSHGYAVVQEIEKREGTTGKIYPANLYRRVRDLLAKGLVEDAPPPDGETGDPRRRYVQVTELGRAVARAETERLGDLLAEARDRGLRSTTG
jgi:DNA-binding PadR family transcriptional regulator